MCGFSVVMKWCERGSVVFSVLRRRIWSLLIPALAVFGLAAAAAWLLPRKYESAATIRVERTEMPREQAEADLSAFARERLRAISYRALTREKLQYWLSWWHDLLTLLGGAGEHVVNVDQLAGLRHWAELVTLRDAKRMVEQLLYVSHAIEHNVSARLALEVLVLSLPR